MCLRLRASQLLSQTRPQNLRFGFVFFLNCAALADLRNPATPKCRLPKGSLLVKQLLKRNSLTKEGE